MKTYIVKESEYPIGNELYQPSYDLVNRDNPTERYIVAPGDFELDEVLKEGEFTVEKRHYTDGTFNVHGNFAVKVPKQYIYKLAVTIEVTVRSPYSDVRDVIDEFGAECKYDLPSTTNVKVSRSEWLDTERTF